MADKPDIDAALAGVMREDRGRLLAALIGQLGDFQLAEDCLHEALASALEHWARSGLPHSPAGWLLQVARRKAIDRLRHDRTAARYGADIQSLMALDAPDPGDGQEIPDERLRLIFTCCHPALDAKTRVALTLRTLGGLTTGEIARAFLDSEGAMAQRLVRARHKIARARVPYAVPDADLWPERLPYVLAVIYLIFNEGYAASSGDRHIRADLCDEALFLGRTVVSLGPPDAEAEGLLALMLLIDARAPARLDDRGAMVALEDQDRGLWDRGRLADGLKLVERALSRHRPGPYQIKAAIQGVHADADTFAATDWREILGLYDVLLRFEDTAITRLNRAVALSFARSAQAGLHAVLPLRADLSDYAPYFAAEADLRRRTGDRMGAMACYDRAIALTGSPAERAFLSERRTRCGDQT